MGVMPGASGSGSGAAAGGVDAAATGGAAGAAVVAGVAVAAGASVADPDDAVGCTGAATVGVVADLLDEPHAETMRASARNRCMRRRLLATPRAANVQDASF